MYFKVNIINYYYISSCSLSKNFEELQNLLQSTNNFDVIVTTETRIPKNNFVTQNIGLNNYSFRHTLQHLQQEAHFYL